MSSKWRLGSNDHWEMTQSLPSSELPNDPIVSSSSQSEERSASPAMAEGMDEFSYAAQAETEPIPPNNPFDNMEDMLILSSPPRPSGNIINSPSEAVSNQGESDRDASDPDDSDFELSESGNNSDSVYEVKTTQRRGKKTAPAKNVPKKTVEKSRTATTKGSQRVTTKGGATSKKTIPDSQLPAADTQKTTKQTATRLPKKSFYSQPNDGPSTHGAPKTGNDLASKSGKQASNDRDDTHSALPAEAINQVAGDSDVWYPPESPGKPEDAVQQEVQVTDKRANLGKKRGAQKQSSTKSRNTKTYSARPAKQPPKKSEPVQPAVQHEEPSRASGSTQKKNPKSASHGKDANRAQNAAGTLAPIAEQSKSANHEYVDLTQDQDSTSVSIAEQGESADHGYIDLTQDQDSTSVSTTSEKDLQQNEVTPPAPVLKPVSPGLSDLDDQEVPEVQPQPVNVTRGSPGMPDQKDKLVGVVKDAVEKKVVRNHSSGHQEHSVESIQERDDVLKTTKGKAKEKAPEQLDSTSSARNANSRRSNARPSDEQKDRNSGKVHNDRPQRGPIMVQEQVSVIEPKAHQQRQVPPAQHVPPVQHVSAPPPRYSMASDSGSPLGPSSISPRDIATNGRIPREAQHMRQEEQRGPSARNHLPAFTDTGSSLFEAEMTSSTSNAPYNTRYTAKPGFLQGEENRYYIPGGASQTMRNSSATGDMARRANDGVSHAPQLHEKSINFARRVMNQQNKMESEDNRQEPSVRKGYSSVDQFPSSQPKAAMKYRAEPTAIPPMNLGDRYSKGGRGRSSNSNLEPTYKTKWKEAVDEASNGAADALHEISTNLLENLRSREESVFAVVDEYKRNGEKIAKRVVARQEREFTDSMKIMEQKSIDLVKFYDDLSKSTKDFRTKSLARQSKAREEWQRHTEKVKEAIRKAREAANLN